MKLFTTHFRGWVAFHGWWNHFNVGQCLLVRVFLGKKPTTEETLLMYFSSSMALYSLKPLTSEGVKRNVLELFAFVFISFDGFHI